MNHDKNQRPTHLTTRRARYRLRVVATSGRVPEPGCAESGTRGAPPSLRRCWSWCHYYQQRRPGATLFEALTAWSTAIFPRLRLQRRIRPEAFRAYLRSLPDEAKLAIAARVQDARLDKEGGRV